MSLELGDVKQKAILRQISSNILYASSTSHQYCRSPREFLRRSVPHYYLVRRNCDGPVRKILTPGRRSDINPPIVARTRSGMPPAAATSPGSCRPRRAAMESRRSEPPAPRRPLSRIRSGQPISCKRGRRCNQSATGRPLCWASRVGRSQGLMFRPATCRHRGAVATACRHDRNAAGPRPGEALAMTDLGASATRSRPPSARPRRRPPGSPRQSPLVGRDVRRRTVRPGNRVGRAGVRPLSSASPLPFACRPPICTMLDPAPAPTVSPRHRTEMRGPIAAASRRLPKALGWQGISDTLGNATPKTL